MIANRSVPVDTILPHVVYQDVPAAIAWLTRVFGFREHYHYGEPAQGAQMFHGQACIMIRSARGESTPSTLGYGTQSLTVFLDDVDGHYERAKAAGATIVEDLNDTAYGEHQYAALDLDGHHWLFSRHARDVAPADWGAVVADSSRDGSR